VRGERNITGVCFLRIGDAVFPERDWSDFVVIILGWWLRGLAAATSGLESDLRFMDGPFAVRVHPLADGVARVQLLEDRVAGEIIQDEAFISLPQAIEACLLASSVVLHECAARGWSHDTIEELKELVGSARAV
jgi:hypothetical protein